jgi:16S rRNA (adenine1518-N6/adenine1519-N6)-dimethyltransferase
MYSKPKKRLGQNFLVDKNIRSKVVSACDFGPQDIVIEIGSGRGELTGLIAQNVKEVYAIEIDKDLLPVLRGNLKSYGNVKVIEKDFLKVNLKNLVSKFNGKVKVVGNIPYYISTPIIEHIINIKGRVDRVLITVQKEFAQRIAALPGSKIYGSLSCFVQYYAHPELLFVIRKNSFFPVPKVDSAFLSLDFRPAGPLNTYRERMLFKIIRASFNQRRKTLRNSLKNLVPRNKLEAFFAQNNVDQDVRPEDLSLEQFIKLSRL